MAIGPGARLGPYEIVAPLGAGGWGEVWRARDTRLTREVAIKVLPTDLAGNEKFLARFEREARAVSSLNHPNICTLYDVGVENSMHFIVMELIEGESLADRLAKGPLPPGQVLKLGGQIASALDRAHRQGIIHRDLKPSNVMLTRTGAKLVDFGLAHLSAGSPLLETNSREVTQAVPLTTEGTIVGTIQYMAPEQLEGAEPDARTDIFALGALLYEMATGQHAFKGASKVSLIAAILSSTTPPISEIVPLTPPALDHVVRRCLEKHPDDRWQSAHDVASQLAWISESGSQSGIAVKAPRRRTVPVHYVWLTAAALLAIAAISAIAFVQMRPKETPKLTISRLLPPPGTEFDFTEIHTGSLAISPDGRQIALTAREETGKRALWIQSLDSAEPRRLPATEGARFPFWSPDGRSVAFFADGKLKKIDVTGSAPFVICDAPSGRSGAWNRDGVILFSSEGTKPISRVSNAGGRAAEITTIDVARGETTHRWASFLPDGNHFIYLAGTHTLGSQSDFNAIYVSSLEKPAERKLVLSARSNASYASGHLLYVRDDVLVAQPFDVGKLETVGNPIPITESVRYSVPFFRGVYSVSENGVLVYQPGVANPNSQLAWFDRKGTPIGTLGREARFRGWPSISPTGTQIAASIEDESTGLRDIWIFDPATDTQTRFTFGAKSENTPVWSPDGMQIAYHEQDASDPNASQLMIRAANGREEARIVARSSGSLLPTAWTSDGKTIVASKQNPAGDWDLVTVDLGKTSPALEPLLAREASDAFAVRSPDGEWKVYFSDESGRMELWASPLRGPGGKWQLSNGGTVMSGLVWRDGEVVHSRDDGGLYAIPVTASGGSLNPGTATLLFKNPHVLSWTMSPDRTKVLATVAADDKIHAPLTIVQNWPLRAGAR
ncbi:MAG: protein kinase [Thermoanaerobaculia bacterium]|nr:protein kinase [Thermoanaerobaculia bacterium]